MFRGYSTLLIFQNDLLGGKVPITSSQSPRPSPRAFSLPWQYEVLSTLTWWHEVASRYSQPSADYRARHQLVAERLLTSATLKPRSVRRIRVQEDLVPVYIAGVYAVVQKCIDILSSNETSLLATLNNAWNQSLTSPNSSLAGSD